MTAYDESGIVGHLFLRFLDEEKTFLRFGYVIVDNEKRGKGYGKQLIQVALEYAFTILQAEKVDLGVFENNPPARHCYEAAGFTLSPGNGHVCRIGDEDWQCADMEIDSTTYKMHKENEK